MPRRKIQRAEEPKPDLMRWLLTYADMITLLMIFFIILYSLSAVNPARFQQMQEAFSSVFTGGNFTIFDTRGGGGAGLLQGLTPGQKVQSNRGGRNAGTGGQSILRNQALSSLQNLVKAGKVKVIPTENGFAISLISDLFFASASAALNADAMPVLQQVSDFLGQIPNSVVVEGHTDNIPPDAVRWPGGNWELAAERSIAVLQTLEDYGVPTERLSSSSYGSTRPVQSNNTEEGRAYNRRVDIVIVEKM
ncbi:MAG: OmpA family protein [Spirochaetia bacterium]|jgi:chemotaxis protein MotB